MHSETSQDSAASAVGCRRPALWAPRLPWETLLPAVVAVCFYLPAVRFGLIWDDPSWYQQGAGLSVAALFGPVPTFQFYRPLALLYNRLFVGQDGIVSAATLHAAQILYHGANAALVALLARRLGLSRWGACASGLVFALHPYAHQAVAWQAPQQPLATLCILAIVLCGQRYLDGRGPAWAAVSLATFAVALFYQESVLVSLPLLGTISWQVRGRHDGRWQGDRRPLCRRHAWLAGHVIVGCAFALLYAAMPKKPGVTGVSGREWVGAYALQAVVPPIGAGLDPAEAWPAALWIGVFALVTTAIALPAWRRRARACALAGIWFAAGAAPALLGLSWEYVSVGPRLFYPALVGAAVLWGAAIDGERRASGAWGNTPRVLAAVAVLALLGWQILRLQTLYMRATQHLQHTIASLADPSRGTVLYYNFPDRIALRRPPYALGYWGIVLAPPVQRLEDYALAERGASAQAVDVTRLDAGAAEWEASPYRADLRGARVGPDGGLQPGSAYASVYVSRISPQGRLRLLEVGWSSPAAAAEAMARLGTAIRLQAGSADRRDGRVQVRLALQRVQAPLPDDTLFVHVLDADGLQVGGQDGDLWGGFLPTHYLPADTLIGEVRTIDLRGLSPGDYAVTVGLYNRRSGQRYPAYQRDGNEAWNGELQIATVHID